MSLPASQWVGNSNLLQIFKPIIAQVNSEQLIGYNFVEGWNFHCTGRLSFESTIEQKLNRSSWLMYIFTILMGLIPICALKIKDSFTSVSTFQLSLAISFMYWLKTLIFSKMNFMTHWWDCSCRKKRQLCFKMFWTITMAVLQVPGLCSLECQLG